MSIGIVSSEEFEEELRKLKKEFHAPAEQVDRESAPVIQAEIVEKPHKGREEGDTNVPDILRQIIGEESVENGRKSALALADQWGISPSSVSAYAKGATSTTTYDQPKKSLIENLNRTKLRASRKAGRTMIHALNSLTPEKLEGLRPKDVAGIAKDMSAIIKNMEPSSDPSMSDGNTPQFVIFAPQFRDERSFQTIMGPDE